jgi:peptide/nickel transport system substrate-binding protein
MSRSLKVVLLGLLVVMVFAGTVFAQSVFIYGRGGDSVRLDPADITDGESVKACTQIFENLVEFKDNSTAVEPGLATSWEVSEDGLTWTFNLRKGVKFHDGTPFNADAVVFSLMRQKDKDHPAHNGDFAYWNYMYNNVEDVWKTDDYTVKIKLSEPYAPFLYNMASFPVMIVSPTAMTENGVEHFRTHPVGTGPFKFVEWKRNDRIILDKNENYWGKKAGVDRVIIRSIPENTTRLMSLLAGEIHAMDGVSPENIKTLKEEKRKDLKIVAQPGMNVGYLAMNMEKEPFGNKKVRKALAYAINKKKIVSELFEGMAVPAVNMLPPNLWGYNDEIEDYSYNPVKAKTLLTTAGYPDGFKTDLWYMPVPRPYMPDGKLVAQAIQQDLKKIGVECNLVTYDWGTYLEKLENFEHTMCLIGWMGDNGDPDNFLYVLLDKDTATPGSAQNYSNYKSEEYHNMMIEAQRSFDQEKRDTLYKDAQTLLHEDVPTVPIAHAYNLAIVNTSVKGFKLHPTSNFWFDSVVVEE